MVTTKQLQNPYLGYTIAVLVVVLLAPYAGCHLLVTSAPDPIDDGRAQVGHRNSARPATSDDGEQTSNESEAFEPPSNAPDNKNSKDTLSDIEQLLGKRR